MAKKETAVVADPEDIRDFFDGYEDAVISGSRIPDGYYHLKATDNLGCPDWFSEKEENGDRAMTELEVEVASGEYEGAPAPRLRIQLGGFEYSRKKKDGSPGKRVIVTAEEVFGNVRGTTRALHGPVAPQIAPATHVTADQEWLDALADELVGDDFIAQLVTVSTGYQNLKGLCSVDDPPKDFTFSSELEEMKV